MDDGSFRTWQAVGDLVHHIGPLLAPHLGTVAVAMGVSPREAGLAVAALRDDGFAFRREETFALKAGLERLAILDLAVVLLLADALQSRRPLVVGREVVAALPDWPATLRAAVANGLVQARALGLVQIAPLDPALCVTRPAGVIAEHLLQIARSMRRDELAAVAGADHGRDAERHYTALLDCIGRRDGIFPAEGGWFPSGVVNLCADDPALAGHPGCTAILLLNTLHKGDAPGWFGHRWPQQAAAYCALKPSQRDPILAGLRHIYETGGNFNPAQGTGQAIPVVAAL